MIMKTKRRLKISILILTILTAAVIGCGVYVSDYYHDWFGDYGEQEGDGVPTITREEQISETITFCRESGMIMR